MSGSLPAFHGPYLFVNRCSRFFLSLSNRLFMSFFFFSFLFFSLSPSLFPFLYVFFFSPSFCASSSPFLFHHPLLFRPCSTLTC